MAKRTDRTMSDDETVTLGTTNVFADLGYPDAEERQTKLRLAYALNEVIARRRMTQEEAAENSESTNPRSQRSPTTSLAASLSSG